ncbi:hypothetical protein [Actibacterium sp. MT2.3-13A]|uniref:hypothetical protein n=1 Tax=Actibacterium sp. MT2.3-13A TaxID=2828332 RepID=UPI001BAC9C4C|nr:hypothetical protein [Actibacterium sp. MT2.3-13A]
MNTHKFSARRPAAAGLAALFLGISLLPLPGCANSDTPAAEAASASRATADSVALWLNPVKQPSADVARQRLLARSLDSRHGNGSYICSASGFGQRSTCFSR